MKRPRHRNRNYHHLTPRCRKHAPYHGDRENNVVLFDITRHCAWHMVFGNRTLEEVIDLLQRLARMKRRISNE